MIWGAHKADGRLAAKNATKIRAALGKQIDPKRVYERYQETQPIPSGNLAQDRARARAWAMLNVGLDMSALYPALIRLWTEAFVMGELAAREAIRKTEELKKADNAEYIDWDNWTPGDEVAAALVRPPDALKRLLDQAGARIKGLDKESYDEIGSALGESIALGLSSSSAARLIRSKVHSASRALTIAITETNRVASYAAMQTYKEYGLEQHEWQAISPCDKCARNEGAVVDIGSPFPTGVIQPPQHPHCRCALLPVIPDMSEKPNANGVVDIAPQSELITDVPSRRFIAGQDDEIHAALTQEQSAYIEALSKKQLESVAGYQAEGTYDEVNDYLRGKSTRISKENKELIKTLDEVIDGATLDFNTTVYRGVSDDTGDFMNLQVGDRITEKGYSSTSPNPAVAEAFANSTVVMGQPVVLEIDIPYGQPAIASDVASTRLFGRDLVQDDEMIIEITGFTRLNEITLPRNMTFEVTEIVDKESARYVKVRIVEK
jgi:SPP1 gp7 family putative phage head morphogenesis protein